MAFTGPGPTNGYLPVATGQVINFVRKPKHFKTLNAIVQYTPSKLPTGVYARLDRDNGVRVSNEDQFVWADGADLPSSAYFTSRFTTGTFATVRRAYPWQIGDQAEQNASLWQPKVTHMREAISLAMTFRTLRLFRLLETAGTWSGNTDTATNLGGGKWDAGAVATPYFKRGVLAVAAAINTATNGIVEIDQLVMVINRDDAIKIARSAEIMDFMKGSVHTKQMIEDPFGKVNLQWGLPSHYQGVRIVVSTEPKVTEIMNASGSEATANRGLIKSSDSIIFCCVPGTMDNDLSEQSYSTVQIFHYAGVKAKSEGKPDGGSTENDGAGLLEVKGRHDEWNEKWVGAVVEQTSEHVAAPMSGYLVTDVIT